MNKQSKIGSSTQEQTGFRQPALKSWGCKNTRKPGLLQRLLPQVFQLWKTTKALLIVSYRLMGCCGPCQVAKSAIMDGWSIQAQVVEVT